MSARSRYLRVTALVLVFGLLAACKTSDDAVAAAAQLTKTSQQLSAYYSGLDDQVQQSIRLNQIQESVMELPAKPGAQAALETTRVELGKRAALANSLGEVATAYASLAGSKAGSDIATAASGLATECGALKPLPGGPAIPDIVGKAGQLLVDAVREHNLRQSSEAISKAVDAVATLFRGEMGLYESINSDRAMVAAQVAEHLVKKENVVDVSALLAPALKSFDLSATIPAGETPAKYRSLAIQEIKTRRDRQISDFAAASEAMANQLDAVSKQVAGVGKKPKHS
jgi:hypothetical protein